MISIMLFILYSKKPISAIAEMQRHTWRAKQDESGLGKIKAEGAVFGATPNPSTNRLKDADKSGQ